MLLCCINKIYLFIDTVDKLTEINARLHVVVDILKHIAYDEFARIAVRCIQFFKCCKKIIYKLDKSVTSNSFFIRCPIAPTIALGDYAFIVLAKLPFHFFSIKRFQKQKPCDLFDILRIAIQACVFAHNIFQGFYHCGHCHCVHSLFSLSG